VRSLRYSAGLRPGFDSGKQVATFYLVPALKGYDAEQTFRLFEESRLRLLSLPSVRRVSYAIRLPAQGNEAGWAEDFVIPGKEPPSGEQAFHIRYTMVGPDYFELVGTRILRGRGVQEVDRPEGRPVAVISETMAKRIFPSEDPIGKTLVMKDVAREIVGVCEDVRIGSLYEAPEMYVYLPYAQARQGFALLLVELDGDPAVLVRAAKTEIARVAPDVPVLETGSFESHMEMILYEERRDAWIAAAVAGLALALTAVGIYGVVAMVVSGRTREIGIRLALGASRLDVLRLVLSRGVGLAFAGSLAGILVGLLVTRYLESRLHGVGSHDPLSFAIGGVLAVAMALLASLLPAIRASHVDPATTMRSE
jgi:predicted permease